MNFEFILAALEPIVTLIALFHISEGTFRNIIDAVKFIAILTTSLRQPNRSLNCDKK